MILRKEKPNKYKFYIIEAYFILLETKETSYISIQDIAEKAGVSRATFYRNFKSKEEIIEEFFKLRIYEVVEKLMNIDKDKFNNAILAGLIFSKIKEEKRKLTCLLKNGMIYTFLDVLTKYAIDTFGEWSDLYLTRSYCLSGALFNLSIWWLKNDCEMPIDELVKLFLSSIKI